MTEGDQVRRCQHQSASFLGVGLSMFDILDSARYLFCVFVTPTEPSAACGLLGGHEFCELDVHLALSFSSFRVIHGASMEAFAKRDDDHCHVIAIGYPLVIAIMGLVWKAFDPGSDGIGCIASDYPHGCGDSDIECIRGRNAYLFRIAGYGIASGLMFLALLYLNVPSFLQVYSLERKSGRFHLSGSIYRKSRMVATQNILYVLTFLLTYLVGPIILIAEAIKSEGLTPGVYFALALCMDSFYPLQGALNFCIYIRPRRRSFRVQTGTFLQNIRDALLPTNSTPGASRTR